MAKKKEAGWALLILDISNLTQLPSSFPFTVLFFIFFFNIAEGRGKQNNGERRS